MLEFNYQPLSEEEAQKLRFKLLKDGTYKAAIEHAENKLSSKGSPMGVFIMRVWDEDGLPKELTDYIPAIPSMMWKLRHLCESAGLIKEFDEKKFKPELTIGKEVMVNIKTQEGKEIPHDKLNGKTPGSKYPTKNVIDDYLPLRKNNQPEKTSIDHFEDIIPF